MRRPFAFILVLAAFTGAVVAARSWAGAAFDPKGLFDALEAARATGWLLPLYLGSVGVTTFLAPAFAFFAVAGALWGFWPGCLVAWLGASLWSQVHFFAGRWLGGERVKQWLERRGLHGVREELETGGVLATIIVRQFPLPFVGVNLAAGASPMKWWRFTVGNAVGLLPGATVYSWSAASIIAGVEGARTAALLRTLAAALAVIALGVGSRALQRHFRRRGTTPAGTPVSPGG